jgi:purine-nucleoside/S-methyl-5'-thioadenosine phosphorylase / adenosine deaminase
MNRRSARGRTERPNRERTRRTGAGRSPILRVPAWDGIPGLVHGFCGRRGGVSRGAFAELNLSARVGDDPDAVRENWRRVHGAAGPVRFVTMRQIHGVHIGTVESPTADLGDTDGMVTAMAGIALGVLTADCAPILMIAPAQRIAAAVHAGWRGTLGGIVLQALTHLQQVFGVTPAAMSVALGPAIGGCCYEVDRAIADAFTQRWGTLPGAVHRQGNSKAMLDLRRANVIQLQGAGVGDTHVVGPCTRCAAAEYFSYRAANGVTGRQLAFVGWHA